MPLIPALQRIIKTGGDSLQPQSHSEVSWRLDHHFRTEVEVRGSDWLLCFLISGKPY